MEVNLKIETERLYLRPINEDDDKNFFELDSNPKVHAFLGNNPVKSIEESRGYIKSILQQYKAHGIGRLAIIKRGTEEFVGWSGLKLEGNVRAFDYYDLGYRLKEEFWGHGYATEAAMASLDYGFKDLRLKEICAAAHSEHKASNKILKSIGLKPTGTFTYENILCNWYTLKNPML